MEPEQAVKQIRLIALDLDGSSMNSKGVVSGRTRRAIGQLVRRGYEVVPATGRGFYHLRENVIGVNGIRYVISANGAVITDGATGRRLEVSLIPCRIAASLAEELLRRGTCVYLHRNDACSTHVMACRDRGEYDAWFARPEWPSSTEILTERLGEFILRDGRDVIKLGIYFHGFDGFTVFESLTGANYPEIHSFRVGDCAMEFTSSKASKADALRSLCGYLRIPLKQVCAVGDNGNDVEMLRIAGLGIAVGNAIEEAKQAADAVIKSNDEEGVAEFLETHFLV
ncbi:HAD hydrolase family protein [Caproicibacter fermentans]|uniref:HAD hydrolase family protein n=1 Tax=Caproicibacter fermentans TaxID=2576756 RepID=A0A7G8T652_9FIRM|nr:HAD hydrolase family protein [Caproicibacter fermentans]QNK39093.1 HAD hydrolase family protein [Caproicibacter fermentans]